MVVQPCTRPSWVRLVNFYPTISVFVTPPCHAPMDSSRRRTFVTPPVLKKKLIGGATSTIFQMGTCLGAALWICDTYGFIAQHLWKIVECQRNRADRKGKVHLCHALHSSAPPIRSSRSHLCKEAGGIEVQPFTPLYIRHAYVRTLNGCTTLHRVCLVTTPNWSCNFAHNWGGYRS